MEGLGRFADARSNVLPDVNRSLSVVQRVASTSVSSVASGIAVLKQLRAETYEDLNQIQHEYMILCAAEWLVVQKRCPPDTLWSWNPRQTGLADEPDVRGECNGVVVLSAEITASTEPKGLIDSRMRDTLRSWLVNGSTSHCHQRCASVRARRSPKAGWQIEAVHLVAAADGPDSVDSPPAATASPEAAG